MTLLSEAADVLSTAGVAYGFGITGSGSTLELITELEDRGVRYYPASHEAAAAIMAGTVFQLDGQKGVAVSIKGPGLANMLPGIAHHHFENNFVVTISEAFGASAPESRQHKRLNHPALLSTLVKSHHHLGDLGQPLVDGLRLAAEEIPGPIHLDLCQYASPPGKPAVSASPPPARLDRALAMVDAAQRPVLIVGGLARRRGYGTVLRELTIPTFTTVAAKGVIDETGDHSAGIFTGDGQKLSPEVTVLAEADLVIGLGLRNTEVLSARRFCATVLFDDVPQAPVTGFEAECLVAPLTGLPLDSLGEHLRRHQWGGELLGEARQKMRRHLLGAGFLPAKCYEVVNQRALDSVLVMDTGSFCTIAEHVLNAGPRRPFLASSNGRYMGTSIPMAIGAAIAGKGKPVVCFVGDGGIRMYLAELRLAAHENLPICFVFLRDGQFGSVACVPQRRPMSRHALEVAGPSWWRAAEAGGIPAVAVDSEEEFARAYGAWSGSSPLFIEVSFDPESYLRMTAGLR